MSYEKKVFMKKHLKEGQLIEYREANTNNNFYYLVVSCGVRKNGIVSIERLILMNNKGNVITLKDINDDLSYKNLVLSKVYSNILHSKAKKDKNISLMDPELRVTLFDNKVVYMSQKEVIQMLARQVDKNIIIV